MSAGNGDFNQPLASKPESLLKPLPSLRTQAGESKLDAGLRSLDHYRTKLPLWRYLPRQWLIPLVRWETPYLAAAQKAVRTSALDTYFSITANLGTHMFFMIVLPILFWCGYTHIGRGAIHILASGVFFSGFIKDMWCLPRPLSPPLQRITMSKSAALEYGFPSTHSTNAVSVTVYALLLLQSPDSGVKPEIIFPLQILFCAYAFSIILGRLYCGMHGFFDVIVGSALGALISLLQFNFGYVLDDFIYTGSFKAPAIVILIILVLVRIHPEPADDCPCFDDSVAFAGVVIGAEFGNWEFGQSSLSWNDPFPATIPYKLDIIGWPKTIARILCGVAMIFAWRETMKPTLLTTLPPLFRIIERLGLSLPRRFFKRATEYKTVPNELKDDDLIPSVTQIPSMLTSIRHPRRSRSISVGPQSEADAYETLAYREKRRRENKSERTAAPHGIAEGSIENAAYFGLRTGSSTSYRPATSLLGVPSNPNGDLKQALIEAETAVYTPIVDSVSGTSRASSQERREFEREDREMFSKLEKPRVRYDVEVITKLIVYAGEYLWITAL